MAWGDLPDATRGRMEKLFELTKRGVGGERETAAQMLEKLLAEHSLTMADLEMVGEAKWYEFDISGHHGDTLLFQILRRIMNIPDGITYRECRDDKTKIAVEVTRAVAVEAMVTFSVYRKALDKELDASVSAFIAVNKIYSDNALEAGDDAEPLTEEQRLQQRRVQEIAWGMQPTQVRKQLT